MRTMARAGRAPLIVLSAGNHKYDASWSGFPKVRDDYPNQVITVGGSTSAGALWVDAQEGSATGQYVDVMAPAKDIFTYRSSGGIGS